MKIAFISFNSSLGGSELLWTHTARAALADGDQVFMSLVKNSLRHSIYQEMVRAGARASHRRSWGSAKLTRMASRWRNPMGAMTRWKPDVIMFNQSSAFDFVTQYDIENLRRITCDYRIPYVVVCHSH